MTRHRAQPWGTGEALGPVYAHSGVKCIDYLLSSTQKPESNSSNSVIYDFILGNPGKCTIRYAKESAIHKDFYL